MITFYADVVAENLEDPNIGSSYLVQHIELDQSAEQHFTVYPQLDISVLQQLGQPFKIKKFTEYTAGKNVVLIGLHGGWSVKKLNKIRNWFLSDQQRTQAWHDPQCLIVLDYCEEGFTTEVFDDLWPWIHENNLANRVLYVSSSVNVEDSYQHWCKKKLRAENMRSAWYGFFPRWSLKNLTNSFTPDAHLSTVTDQRFMCLNRRPHPHRILLITLLEHYDLLNSGATSFPLKFDEKEVVWHPDYWDIPLQWDQLEYRANGKLDYLRNSFTKVYEKLPLVADTDVFSTNYAMDMNSEFYQRYPINIVSETLFFTEATFTSEKLWKPMMMGQIFFVMAAPFYLADIRKLGFETFSPYIDEYYDTILDPVDRAVEMISSLKKVTQLNPNDFRRLLENCRERVNHNRSLIEDRERIGWLINQRVVNQIEDTWGDMRQ